MEYAEGLSPYTRQAGTTLQIRHTWLICAVPPQTWGGRDLAEADA